MIKIEKGAVKCGKREIKLRLLAPEAEEGRRLLQEKLGAAFTEAVVSVIKREFQNPSEKEALYNALLDLKRDGKII